MEDIRLVEADGETKQASSFSEPVDNGLEVRLRVCHESTVISKQGLEDEPFECL